MTPWTKLLESLHSALIDEVTDRHPEPKPVLDLPRRHSGWVAPDDAVSAYLICEFSFEAERGQGLLAVHPGFARALKTDEQALWKSLLGRAGGEFLHRKIQPRLGPASRFAATDPIPSELQAVRRLVWIPVRVPAGSCYLGLGV